MTPLLFLTLSCLLPPALGFILSVLDQRNKGKVRHGLVLTATVVLGLVITLIADFVDKERTWWRYAVPAVAFYWAFYPILINLALLKVHWFYIGTTSVYDRIENWVRKKMTPMFVLFLKGAGLLTGYWAYVYGSIY